MEQPTYPGFDLNFRLRDGLTRARRVVVKFGTTALTRQAGGIDRTAMTKLTGDIAWLRGRGVEVVVVSSGAIHAGREVLGPADGDETMDYLQALSAAGQPVLLHCYRDLLAQHNVRVAQVLLTHEDFKTQVRYLNASNTLKQLLRSGVVPILNENDTVSYREIAIGDNDQLAAMVTAMLDADALVILTRPDGLFDRDPTEPGAAPIPEVAAHDPIMSLKLSSKSLPGRGGMRAKLYAVRRLTPLGIPAVIASFEPDQPLRRALGSAAGTLFHGAPLDEAGLQQRKAWVLATARLDRAVHIDDGAAGAIRRSASLLPSGVVSVKGEFQRGDGVAIVHCGEPIAVGLVEYDSQAMQRIAGARGDAIEAILGYYHSDSVMLGRNIVLRR